jgi:hypothetical protein
MKQITKRSKFIRILWWVGGIFGGLVVLTFITTGNRLARMSETPTAPDNFTMQAPSSDDVPLSTSVDDYSTTRLSDEGVFSVSYASSQEIIPVNQIHQWILHVETADGQSVENATITVDGDMPEHGHGLPTRPQVTKYLGNGDYLVDGMKFQMGGWWVIDFTITTNSHTDAVHFNMKLN